jgi:hypothetical protein
LCWQRECQWSGEEKTVWLEVVAATQKILNSDTACQFKLTVEHSMSSLLCLSFFVWSLPAVLLQSVPRLLSSGKGRRLIYYILKRTWIDAPVGTTPVRPMVIVTFAVENVKGMSMAA